MLSAQEKAIAQFRASGISAHMNVNERDVAMALGKRKDGVSEDFPGGRRTSEPDSDDGEGFRPIYDGKGGSERARVDTPEGAGVPEGERRVHLDGRDGEDDDDKLAKAHIHVLAKDHDEEEAVRAGICEGAECKIDHLAEHIACSANICVAEA